MPPPLAPGYGGSSPAKAPKPPRVGPTKPKPAPRKGYTWIWDGKRWVSIKVAGTATVTPLAPEVRDSAESEADSIIAELLAELGLARGSARAEAERTAQQEIARAQALATALQSLGIPGQIQNIYGSSAQSIAGLASGFSGDVQGLAAQQGAEQANMVAGTGQEGAVRNEGVAMGDVLYGTQGFIPARGLEQMGAAFASEAALQPGFTMQFGQIAANKSMQDFINNVLPEFTAKEAEIRTKRPSLIQDARERQAALKAEKRKEAIDLYEAGLMTQREFAKQMGVKNWKKFPNKVPSAAVDPEIRSQGGYIWERDPKTGQWKPVGGTGPEPESPTIRSQGGYIWERDPKTGKWVPVAGTGPAPKSAPTPKGYQLKTLKDGSTAVFDPNSGATTVIAPPPKGYGEKKLTPAQQSKYRAMAMRFAKDHFYGWRDDPTKEQAAAGQPGTWHPPLTLSQALEKLKEFEIPWKLGKSIVGSFYKKNFVGPPAPAAKGKGKGKKKPISFVTTAGFTASNEVVDTIHSAAARYGIDPLAAMAVALAEGGLVYGAIGDNGDSHGPFQLNRNGALGRRSPAWANSPAGLRWAIQAMARAGAKGLRGQAAIEAIVRRFERPADPDSEIARALSYYERLLGALSA